MATNTLSTDLLTFGMILVGYDKFGSPDRDWQHKLLLLGPWEIPIGNF